MPEPDEPGQVRALVAALGLPGLIDLHTHFMPGNVLAKVWDYFDRVGPLTGRPWPIAYRLAERERVGVLRAMGVHAFTSMIYAHKPGMAAWLNAWARDFARRTPDCLPTATFHAERTAEAYVRDALDAGVAIFKVHVQVGDFDPNDELLTPVWGMVQDAGTPVVIHCGSGPAPGGSPDRTGSRRSSPGSRGCGRSSRTWGCRSTPSSSTWPSGTTACTSTPRWRSPTSPTRTTRSRRNGSRTWRPSATGSCSAATSRTSPTPIRTPYRPWRVSASATTGCGASCTPTPPGSSGRNRPPARRGRAGPRARA